MGPNGSLRVGSGLPVIGSQAVMGVRGCPLLSGIWRWVGEFWSTREVWGSLGEGATLD